MKIVLWLKINKINNKIGDIIKEAYLNFKQEDVLEEEVDEVKMNKTINNMLEIDWIIYKLHLGLKLLLIFEACQEQVDLMREGIN